jgi:ADP-ribose pyrophosphatase YjhB (NUDIX family)
MPTNPYGRHDAPIVTVDVVIFTLDAGELKIVVAKRPREPDLGVEGLIGGWVHTNEDETLEETVERVLRVKAGLENVFVEQLETVSSATRHPEGWSLSVVYMAVLPVDELQHAFDLGCVLRLAETPGRLAMDHEKIVGIALRRLRGKGAYSTIPMEFLPEEFSMPQLQSAYESVMGEDLDQSSFRKRMIERRLVVETGRREVTSTGRKAELYRANEENKGTFDRSLRR